MIKKFSIIIICILLILLGIYFIRNNSFDKNAYDDIIYYETDENSGKLKANVVKTSCFDDLTAAGITKDEIVECDYAFDEETGALREDFDVILIELEIENMDAVSQVVSHGAKYPEDVFQASVFQLADVTEKVTSGNYATCYLAYFSESNSCAEHTFAFKLPIGEKRTFVLGYLSQNKNLEELYLCPTSGSVKGDFAAITN